MKTIKVPVKITTFVHKDTTETFSVVRDDNSDSDGFEGDIFGIHFNVTGLWKVSGEMGRLGHKEIVTETTVDVKIK